MVPCMEPAKVDVAEIEREIMSDTVVEKIWQIAAHGDKGPITISLRMPEVRITDSDGRHILIAPQQADIVSSRLSDIAYWIDDGARD